MPVVSGLEQLFSYLSFTQLSGSSALAVLSLQPVFVDNDGENVLLPHTSSARCFF
jgi:hypothetical protein